MGSLKKWYKMSPFLEGISSAFDLFGYGGLTHQDIKKKSSERIKRNTLDYDFAVVGGYVKEALDQKSLESK